VRASTPFSTTWWSSPPAQRPLPGADGVVGIRLSYEPQGLLAAWSVRTRVTGRVVAAELR
jgi:hypothetical protein